MQNELDCIIDCIIKKIQYEPVENAEEICLILNSSEVLTWSDQYTLHELESMQEKIKSAIGILNTQKALVLDELTLINKSKKALDIYG